MFCTLRDEIFTHIQKWDLSLLKNPREVVPFIVFFPYFTHLSNDFLWALKKKKKIKKSLEASIRPRPLQKPALLVPNSPISSRCTTVLS